MTDYTGAKSLDAEIILDLESGTVEMDYSLNKFGNPYSSNNSVITESEFKNLDKKQKNKWAFRSTLYAIFTVALLIEQVFFVNLTNKGYIKNKNYQIEFQKLLREGMINAGYSEEQSVTGSLNDTKHVFHIPSNLWLKYELDGDYQTLIKKISLKRHMRYVKRFGTFRELRQHGWDVIFEFISPPSKGGCFIEYV